MQIPRGQKRAVVSLYKLLTICEHELDLLDMVINVKKSCCLRIAPRNTISSSSISTSKGIYRASTGERNTVFGYLRKAGGVTSKAFGLAISRSQVQILLGATLRNNLR